MLAADLVLDKKVDRAFALLRPLATTRCGLSTARGVFAPSTMRRSWWNTSVIG